jgi:hypothetical protein
MQGQGTLFIYDYDVLFKGAGTVTFGADANPALVSMAGAGYLYANGTTDHGRGIFPALKGQGFSNGVTGYGYGFALLPRLMGGGEASVYTPAVAQFGLGLFPALNGAGSMTASSSGECTATLPRLLGRGGEDGYGDGYGVFGSLRGTGLDDFYPGQAMMAELIVAFDGAFGQMDHILFIDNRVGTACTVTATREQIQAILERVEAGGSCTVMGDFLVEVLESVRAHCATLATVGTLAAVDPGSRVWVVNLDTGASSQYDNYGFHSFFERDGEYFGVAEDGIYRLDGDTDNGRDINALVETGISDYGSRHVKRLRRVYVGATSDGNLLLKLEADGASRIYEAVSHDDTAMTVHRFNIQRKDIGHYLNFTLINQDGDDFDLEKIDFTYINLSRRF